MREETSDNFTVEELCNTIFYLSRYAEALEIDGKISVPDEEELFWMIFEWAKDFENAFDPASGLDHQMELVAHGAQWLTETFPYMPEMEMTEM